MSHETRIILVLGWLVAGCGKVAVSTDGAPTDAAPGDGAVDALVDTDGGLALGSECVPAGPGCASGHCVDGYCCASSCAGQCEACDVAGQEGSCIPVNGPPHGDRDACDGEGDCAGSCDGSETAECTYPTDPCREASCEDGVAIAAASCSQGTCPTPVEEVCANSSSYCGAAACADIADVRAGYDYTCVRMSDGSIRCWGANESGQLGVGDTEPRVVPTLVPGFPSADKLAVNGAYGGHTCAVLSDRTLFCWGANGYGELGIGGADWDPHPDPVAVLKAPSSPQDAVNHTTAGWNGSCLLDASNTARCWGWNYYGSVGDGNSGNDSDRYYTTPVSTNPGGLTFTRLATGYAHSCALSTEATPKVYCWGDNSSKAVGLDSPSVVVQATAVATQPPVNGILAEPLVLGDSVSCAIATNSTLRCWGSNYNGLLGQNTQGTSSNSSVPAAVCRTSDCSQYLATVSRASIGEAHACAITSGTVRCWGRNNHGQLGNGTNNPLYYAGTGPTLSNVTRVACGGYHTCAVAGGELWCWGWNSSGQLGTTGDDAPDPVKVPAF